MKLQDLAAPQKTKQVAKVMESYFGNSVAFDKLSQSQARSMLNRVRGLISEQRRQSDFHSSEQNPAYLKLVMLEQGLSSRINEQTAPVIGATPAGQPNTANMAMQLAQQRKQIDDQIKQHQEEIRKLQQQRNAPAGGMAESRRRLKESEVQQAQVVLASQDMVDQVQKMIEQVTSMQFKDLPALVDQIKNEVGVDQAQQFNADATAALAGLTQNLQGSKGQLETALGVVTGQAPAVPGQELATPVADMGAEMPPESGEEELDLDLDVEEEPSSLETTLGRGKR